MPGGEDVMLRSRPEDPALRTGGPPYPRTQARGPRRGRRAYSAARRSRTLITVRALHGFPVGVGIARSFIARAAAWADRSTNSSITGAIARARAAESAERAALISGSFGPPSLMPRCLAA